MIHANTIAERDELLKAGQYRVYASGSGWDCYEAGDELPPEPAPEPAPRMLTVHEFRTRFSDAELAAIALRAYGGAGDALAAVLLLKLQTRTEIDLDDPALIDGLNYLVSVNVLTANRATELRA